MHSQIAGIQGSIEIDLDWIQRWFRWYGVRSRVVLGVEVEGFFWNARVRKDKVQAVGCFEDSIEYAGQLRVVAHIGLEEMRVREECCCFLAAGVVAADDVDLPGAGFAELLGDIEANSACLSC